MNLHIVMILSVCLSLCLYVTFVSTGRTLAKIKNEFVDFDMCHRMASLLKLNIMTLTYFLIVKKFENLISLKRLELAQKYIGRLL